MEEKKKVLIVEYEDTIREPLAAKCEREGFNVVQAKNGREGFQKALETRPDIILMDVVMPRMDGLESLNQIRTSGDFGKNVPVIMLTNLLPDDHILNEMTKNTPTYYFIKSDTKIEEIIDKINSCL